MSDPVEIHDELSKGFNIIEKVIREETAKMTEIIREAIVQKSYTPIASSDLWTNSIPEPCKTCSNHPSNGGSGVCHCTLGIRTVASSDCSWKESYSQ